MKLCQTGRAGTSFHHRLVVAALVPLAFGAILLGAGSAAASTVTVTAAAHDPVLASGVVVDGVANTVTLTADGVWGIGGTNVLGDNYGPAGSTTGFSEPWCMLVPSAPMGSLVGTLDSGASWFAIGAGPTVITGSGNLGFAANDCAPGGDFGYFVDNHGSVTVTVTSNPRLPTLTAQCKNNGWRSYGVFKNQGDCVSFVATGGRNTPAG